MHIKIPEQLEVVITHEPCSDGFTAAWSAWKRFPSAEFLPGIHEKGKTDLDYWLSKVKGKHTLVCDFSFNREMTEAMHKEAASFTVLDHHATAREVLGDLPYCYFDMTRSGALITWETLHPNTKVPLLVQYVSDRDLWKHEMEFSKEINTYIHRQDRTFKNWDTLSVSLENDEMKLGIRGRGEAMLKCQESLCNEMAVKAVAWEVAGTEVWAANSSCMASEVCEVLQDMHPGPVGIYDIWGDSVKFSLRSRGEFSVGDLAKRFSGGGGHRNASGFSVPIGQVDWVNKKINP